MAKQLRIVQDLVEAAQQYPVDVGREVGKMPERLMEGVVDQFEELPDDLRRAVDSFLGYGAEAVDRFTEKVEEVAGETAAHARTRGMLLGKQATGFFAGARSYGEELFNLKALRDSKQVMTGEGLERPFAKTPPPAPVANKLALPKVDSCFIATALAKAHGLGDDCHMLRVLREFRDTYMQEAEYRRELVEQYYREAPAITEALKDSLIWDYAASVIWYVVRDIETGYPDVAMERYKGLFCTMRYEAAKARER